MYANISPVSFYAMAISKHYAKPAAAPSKGLSLLHGGIDEKTMETAQRSQIANKRRRTVKILKRY